jgi:hypothetical protein
MAAAPRMRRILLLAAIATVVYAVTVMVWPVSWRHSLIYLGGSWSLLLLIFGERHWQLTIRQVHEQVKKGRLRASREEMLLQVVALGLMIYGIGDYF